MIDVGEKVRLMILFVRGLKFRGLTADQSTEKAISSGEPGRRKPLTPPSPRKVGERAIVGWFRVGV